MGCTLFRLVSSLSLSLPPSLLTGRPSAAESADQRIWRSKLVPGPFRCGVLPLSITLLISPSNRSLPAGWPEGDCQRIETAILHTASSLFVLRRDSRSTAPRPRGTDIVINAYAWVIVGASVDYFYIRECAAHLVACALSSDVSRSVPAGASSGRPPAQVQSARQPTSP